MKLEDLKVNDVVKLIHPEDWSVVKVISRTDDKATFMDLIISDDNSIIMSNWTIEFHNTIWEVQEFMFNHEEVTEMDILREKYPEYFV